MQPLTKSRKGTHVRRSGAFVASGIVVSVFLLSSCGEGEGGSVRDGDGADVRESAVPEAGPGGGEPVAGALSSGVSRPPASLAAPAREIPVAELGYTVGEATAPLRVLEFSDFGCGYCRQFHLEVYPTIEREYVASGKVQWKYVPMILGIFGPTAELAAHAGECAIEQGSAFPEMRDRIFAEQALWKRASDPLALMEGYARDVGLDVPRWSRCVQEERRGDRIASGTTLGLRSGVRGTPTFFVIGHGTIPGSLPLELFRQILDEALAAETGP